MVALQDLNIEATEKTPQVEFNAFTGDLILSGRSIPENASDTYTPVLNWIKEYINDPRKVTNFRINLEYFNTSSSIWIAKITRNLASFPDPDSLLFIHLYFHYDEFEDMEEEDIKEVLSPIIDSLPDERISVGMKLHGIDSEGIAQAETTILI